MTASEIVDLFAAEDKFGSLTAFSRAIGVPLSTVSSWRQFNQIPAWRQPKLLELAVAHNIALSSADFPLPEERVSAA
jgi:hypothetical protein